jgi:hypothetical protein
VEPVPPVNRPADAGTIIATILSHLAALQNSPQLGSSTITNGALQVTDALGNVTVQVGLLPDGVTFGLGVLPYGGTQLQQVGGTLFVAPPDAVNVATNAAEVAFGAPNLITARIGNSGLALVSVSGYLSTGVAGQQASIKVRLDGTGTPSGFCSASSGAGSVSFTSGSSRMISGLAPGVHSFSLTFSSINDGSGLCNFSKVMMMVQPL